MEAMGRALLRLGAVGLGLFNLGCGNELGDGVRLAEQARDDMASVVGGLHVYYLEKGAYPAPSRDESTRVLVEALRAEGVKLREGLVSEAGVLIDPWGRPYVYDGVCLRSVGPNGKDDKTKGDDVVNWMGNIGR